MSDKFKALIVGLGASLAFVVGSMQGCGGTGGSGGSGSGWVCGETGGTCSCAKGAGNGKPSCTDAYTCCFSWTTGGVPACNCGNLTPDECTGSKSGVSGGTTEVSRCPPP